MIEGKVSEIIDQYTIAINIGELHNVSENMKFQVFAPIIEIFDPETKEKLGEFEYLKATVKIIKVNEKFSIAESIDTMETSILPFPTFTTLKIKKLPAESFKIEKNIEKGDYVKQLNEENIVTYVKCDYCEKEFKSPIQVKNLAESIIKGNKTICPHCKKETLIENRNMINRILGKLKT